MKKKVLALAVILSISMYGCQFSSTDKSSATTDTSSKSSQTQTNNNTKENSEEKFYGEWAITRLLGFGPSSTYINESAAEVLGKNFCYSKDSVIIGDKTLKNPTYKKLTQSKKEFETATKINLSNIGVTGDSVQQITVDGIYGLGKVFYVKDENALILSDGGAYFLLEKAK